MSMIASLYGSMVFNDDKMKKRLPADVYKRYHQCLKEGSELSSADANVIANEMKDWAVEMGATHYTHWFQPMTGITAEKHDSFIEPEGDSVIMKLSGKELIKGEADASSFPNGGLRSTFEARGYTAWDMSSYAFIKDGTLCIPTVFLSYGGESLDKKTPLLKSEELIEKQAKRLLHLLGKEVSSVITTVGAEQEYFLIDKKMYHKRKDLVYTGRTLFGNRPPKTQELDDHYFGVIKPRVLAFMKELNEECWKLGIPAKTQHNEVAPCQHELAPIFTLTNRACDQNQIIMELMKKVADRHDLVCLLHEKPFNGINGSGKHNNWSMSADGENLLSPSGRDEQFLLFLCAVIQAVDEYPALLRVAAASAGNDHRLGGHEAPPAVLSIFIGNDLEERIRDFIYQRGTTASGRSSLNVDVHSLPKFAQDTSDRNRTSPFAFTGNKFEFRMLGSSQSIACSNINLNTAVADVMCRFADRLEKCSDDLHDKIREVIRESYEDHHRIIFNGDGYADEWIKEAEKRGLLNLPTTADTLPHYLDPKNIALFERNKIFTESELRSRYEILIENYNNVNSIEAYTMLSIVRKQILPSALEYTRFLSETLSAKKAAMEEADISVEKDLIQMISAIAASAHRKTRALHEAMKQSVREDKQEEAYFFKNTVLPLMEDLRSDCDQLETYVAKEFWKFPTYGDILYYK